MHIAFAHMYTLRNPRGIERYVINVSNELVGLGHQVTIITGKCDDSITRRWLDDRVRLIEISHYRWHKLTFVPSFFREFITGKYDVVNLALARGEGYAAGLAYMFKKFRYNIIFHYPYEKHEKHVHAFKLFNCVASADRLIAVSEYVAKGIGRYFNRTVDVIPNGVDTQIFRPDHERRKFLRDKLAIAENAKVLLTVSALQGRKGIHKVLELVAILKKRIPDIRYIVVGDGTDGERAELSAKVSALDLQSNVLFTGNQSDVAPYYNAADLFVFFPDFEAFGIVVLEAMASGVPVIVSNNNAFPEILLNGGGILIDQGNAETDVETILSIIDDPDRMIKLGEEGIAAVNYNYRWDSVALKLESLFARQCIQKSRTKLQ